MAEGNTEEMSPLIMRRCSTDDVSKLNMYILINTSHTETKCCSYPLLKA